MSPTVRTALLTAALLGAVVAGGACGPWAAVAAPPRSVSLEVPVTTGTIGERAARLALGAPLAGEVVFDLARCEFAGTGRMRLDLACVGTFTLRTPRGTLAGGARSLWSGYRKLVALHGTVRTGTGCYAGVASGEVHRDGPVSFPTLPLRVTLTLPAGSACLPAATVDEAGLVRAARAADPAASEPALTALARALAAPNDELRAAAAVALGFVAPDPVYRVFFDALRATPGLLAQAERTRELRALGPPPSRCDAGEPDDPELAALCAAARRGFPAARPALEAALASAARQTRREAALLTVREGGAAARPLLEPVVRRALAAGDLAAAVDLAEALLLAPAR